uniref:Metallophos domain-containing protein n=1 Tax=Heligmosomoides polygyrus TaxID=6339 RepID=A0A8L8KAR6_HELPZ
LFYILRCDTSFDFFLVFSTSEISDRLPDAPTPPTRKLRIAVAGCAHGEMDKIYAVLAEIEKEKGYKFDLLICCGDYQSVRNYGDLYHMHVNEKYRSLQTFYKYYSGEKEAPILTVFVGGNHEASGYLAELPNGGWVAPKIYYMGLANVIRFAGLRIAGLSGIYNGREFNRGHYERPPYTDHSEVVSSYHVRNIDVWRLKHLRPADDDCTSNPIDIVITHDWPAGIVDFGDKETLLRTKPFFRDDVESGKLGNPSTMQLLYVGFCCCRCTFQLIIRRLITYRMFDLVIGYPLIFMLGSPLWCRIHQKTALLVLSQHVS